MKKTTELTEAQWRIYHRLNEILREARSNNIGFILKGEDVFAINTTNVAETFYPDEDYENEEEYETEEVTYEDMPLLAIVPLAVGGVLDEAIGIAYKHEEDEK